MTNSHNRFSSKRTDNLAITAYATRVVSSPKGLMLVHEAIVTPEACHGREQKIVKFAVPMAQQDDLQVLENRWKLAIDQLQMTYAIDGRIVDLDIKIPMFIIEKRQAQTPEFIKEFLNEDSAYEQ